MLPIVDESDNRWQTDENQVSSRVSTGLAMDLISDCQPKRCMCHSVGVLVALNSAHRLWLYESQHSLQYWRGIQWQ